MAPAVPPPPHRTRLRVDAEVGVNAKIYFEPGIGVYPTVEIHTSSIEIVLAPRSLADGDRLTECEVTVWRDLAGAFIAMSEAVAQIHAAQHERPRLSIVGKEVTSMTEELPQEVDDQAEQGPEDVDGNADGDTNDQ